MNPTIPSNPFEGLTASDLCPWKGERDAVVTTPEEPLSFAILRMLVHGFSQVPVVEGGRVRGLLDEAGALQVLLKSPDWLEKPVKWAMAPAPPVVGGDHPATAAVDLLLAGAPVVLVEGDGGPWLVTRSDLLRKFVRVEGPEYVI